LAGQGEITVISERLEVRLVEKAARCEKSDFSTSHPRMMKASLITALVLAEWKDELQPLIPLFSTAGQG
jgi:hypothetical protein